ncbi:hypothetical protein RLOatenuis_0320 [Rickettsiales bacterium]|nr:hypothetical protein RLOatenuis_0320 [Rickettsiales bacterium]
MGGMGNTYLGFYGWLPMVKEYELTGTKGTASMDVIKMERENGFGVRVVAGYQSSYNGLNLEVEGGFESRTDKLKSVETKKAKQRMLMILPLQLKSCLQAMHPKPKTLSGKH